MPRILFNLLMLSCCFNPVSAQTNELRPILKLVSGESLSGDLRHIQQSAISFDVDSVHRDFPIDQVTELRFAAPQNVLPQRFEVRLIDDSFLNSDSISITDGNARITIHEQFSLDFLANSVHSVAVSKIADDIDLTNQWNTIVDDEARVSDVIVVNREGRLETIEGVLGDLQNDKISFTVGDRSANIELNKITGMIFYRAHDQDAALPVCAAKLRNGSQLKLKQVEWAENELQGKTADNQAIRIPAFEISTLDFAMGRDVYLDDLTPTTNDWKPWLASQPTVETLRRLNLARVKHSFSGKPLSLLMRDRSNVSTALIPRQFEHGFAVRGGGKLAFQLNGDYTSLTGWIGFDPAANQNGNVQVTIQLDNVVIWQQNLQKREMHQPIGLDLDISGGRRIVFQVDYADGRTVGDQVHLVDLRVAK